MVQMQFKTPKLQGKAQQAKRKLEILEEGAVLRMCKANLQISSERPVAVAAFDLDGTLISTKSGYTFARDGYDWKLLPGVEEAINAKLAEMRSASDAQVVCVLFTNQGGVISSQRAKSFINLRTKLDGVADRLRFIDIMYASLQIKDPALKAQFRKPGCGMFDLLKSQAREIDMSASFYVGDAAGRPRDHSADDRGFAEGAKLRFYTPEEFLNDYGRAKNAEPDANTVDTEGSNPDSADAETTTTETATKAIADDRTELSSKPSGEMPHTQAGSGAP